MRRQLPTQNLLESIYKLTFSGLPEVRKLVEARLLEIQRGENSFTAQSHLFGLLSLNYDFWGSNPFCHYQQDTEITGLAT